MHCNLLCDVRNFNCDTQWTAMFWIVYIINLFTITCSYKYTNADYMDSLDYLICTQIKEPTSSFCDSLCENMDRYYDNLQALLESLRNGEVEKVEAIAGFWALGKPNFTEDFDHVTIGNLKTILLETKQDIKTFIGKVEKVKLLWEEFKNECEKENNKYLCEPVPGYFN